MIKKALLVSLLATSALAAGALAGQIRVWQWWPVFLIPFAIIGTLLAWRVWHALPAATRNTSTRSKANTAGPPYRKPRSQSTADRIR